MSPCRYQDKLAQLKTEMCNSIKIARSDVPLFQQTMTHSLYQSLFHSRWHFYGLQQSYVNKTILLKTPVFWNPAWICTDSDWGVYSWPWQVFVLGKAEHPLFVTTKRCIPVKTTLDRSAVVFCACEVVSYVVRTVPKSNFRLLINGTPNKWRTVC